ncbi:Saccharopine dehydrogenase-domain-containing protein [Cyathus striatus]|nr:Saccharopine dehydrogenase-domain-containing protein [Cyathus striatus]
MVLTHPSIIDGWFRQSSSQKSSHAITLKVRKILHFEKSPEIDILVFESETYGNVLVVDRTIRCTERDAFSQTITHIPLANHPSPKKVLVIGGGDGGIIHEVLKHDYAQQIVLCGIDEAIPRVSKLFFPHTSSSFSSPKVTTHTTNVLTLLEQHTSTYDIIIVDTMTPDLIALDEKHIHLLHTSLAAEGNIIIAAGSTWDDLSQIKNLHHLASRFFTTIKYAYTTLPTVPSGQIGFIVASKTLSRDLRIPVREVKDTKYYNGSIHTALFVLPEFTRALLEDGKDVTPKIGRDALALLGKPTKKVLLLGSGFVARPAAEYIVRDPSNALTIACRTLSSAQALSSGLPSTTAISLDVNDVAALEAAVAAHDLVVSLVPYTYHVQVTKAAIKGKTHVVTTSYVSPAMRELDEEAKKAGIVVLNEIGLDPGIDHLYAVKMIDEVHAKGGKIKKFLSYCGGLPAPECASNPLGYKFSWSSRGVLLNLLASATYLSKANYNFSEPYFISPAFAFVGYPNRNSVPFKEYYNIPEAETVFRGNLRYQGYLEFAKVLRVIGWLDVGTKEWLSDELTWAEVMQRNVGATDSSEAAIIERVKALCAFPNESESSRIIAGLRWIGLFSNEKVSSRHGTLLDTLCARFEVLMAYEEGERDMVMLQHKFYVEWSDGKQDIITSTLEAYGSPHGHSAMALHVGVPCGIATQLILDGKGFATHSEVLEEEGIALVEKVL